MPWSIQIGWDDVPHIDEDWKRKQLASVAPHQRDARSKGIPRLGAGAIYPVLEDDIVCDPVSMADIPLWLLRGGGFDVGWSATAAVLGIKDVQTDVITIVAEYKRSAAEPAIHAAAVRPWGDWLTYAIDPASRGRKQDDGERLMDMYNAAGMRCDLAVNAVEAGLLECWQRLSTGRLRIARNCVQTLGELRIYARKDNGQVNKKNDHLMDAMRYLVMTDSVWRRPPSHIVGQRRSVGSMGTWHG